MTLITDEIRAKADEYYQGDELCREKTKVLLKEVGLPNGLLPLRDIIEVGYVKETGFVWLKQKKSITHKFEKIGKSVTYATEVTAIAEKNRIRKLTGVKAKELLIWVSLSDIHVDDPPSGKITAKTPTGLSRSYPTAAFEVPELVKKETNEAVLVNGAAAAKPTAAAPVKATGAAAAAAKSAHPAAAAPVTATGATATAKVAAAPMAVVVKEV